MRQSAAVPGLLVALLGSIESACAITTVASPEGAWSYSKQVGAVGNLNFFQLTRQRLHRLPSFNFNTQPTQDRLLEDTPGISIRAVLVPEPAAWTLLFVGFVATAARQRR